MIDTGKPHAAEVRRDARNERKALGVAPCCVAVSRFTLHTDDLGQVKPELVILRVAEEML